MLRLHMPFESCPFEDLFSEISLPYWHDADHNSFDFSEPVGEVVNDDSRFAFQLDVAHFKPENMKIELDGRELKIEGEQEVETDDGYSKRSFSHMVILPEDTILQSIKSAVSDDGKLQIEAPKKNNATRSIPIGFVDKH